MSPDELVTDVRRESNLPSTLGNATDIEIMAYLNRAKDMMAQKIIESDQKYFEIDETLNFTADAQEYDLPRLLFTNKISMVERLNSAGDVLYRSDGIRFQDRDRYEADAATIDDAGRHYYLRGRKIGFVPTPGAALTAAAKLYGIQFPHDMFWGVVPASGLTTTAFVIPASGSDLKAGRAHTETDYYKNAVLRMVEGAARGLERKITAYNAATRTVTIDTAWTTADVTGKQFVILCGIPDEYHQGLISYAIAKIAKKRGDDALFQMANGEFVDMYKSMSENVIPRLYDDNEHTALPIDLDM